jgi:protein-S-isoprenylcysteine O-methyltransferase Ste14
MDQETTFRILFALDAVAMIAIRIYFQAKILPESRRTTITGNTWRLIPGAIAALTSVVFGLAYIFFPRTFSWSYGQFPPWLRWVGGVSLLAGTTLLWAAHRNLASSFHSLVVRKSGQLLVETGPYSRVRHPIYTAYVLSYAGGGLLAASFVLTLIPCPLYLLFIALRIREEESAMLAQFGQAYEQYMAKTPRFVPNLRSFLQHRPT